MEVLTMNILAFTERADHVCYRYRLGAFAAQIERAGGRLTAVPIARDVATRVAQFRAARDADVVILQRRLLPRWQLWLLRHSARALVYDFDDAVFRRSSLSHRRATSWTRQRGFRAVVRAADITIAGNRFLQGAAARLVSPERVELVPTCIDVGSYPEAIHSRHGGDARLVWIGQRSTLRYLVDARTRLAAAAARVPGLSLRVISDVFPTDIGIAVEQRPWSQESETAEIAQADIGISWLSDDDWSRGKCGLKVLQYMAAGLPVVANPVGANCEMVIPGVTGYLAATPDEWAAAVAALARDPGHRRALGENARRIAAERYGVAAWAPRFVQILQRLARYEVSHQRITVEAPATRDQQSDVRQQARADVHVN